MHTTTQGLRGLLAGAVLLGLAACGDGPAEPDDTPTEATLIISADVMATIAGVTIEVTAEDMETTVIVNLGVVDGAVAGTVTIPAGSKRLITGRAYDEGGIETHRGTETIDVEPGDNIEVTLVLDGLNGNQPIVVTFGSYTITLSLPTAVIDIGNSLQLTASVADTSGPVPGASVVWGSTNPGIATVDQTGLVTAGLVGGTSMIVATYQGAAASTTLTVNPPSATADFLVFAGTGTQGWWDIYRMNADGTNVVRLTSDVRVDVAPDVSPDGQRIAYTRLDGIRDIHVMNIDGTNDVRLNTSEGSDLCPRWSPDGTRLAFVSNRDGNDEVYVMDADGTNPVRLTNNAWRDSCPTWAPDGTRLAFGGGGDLNFINVDGTGLTSVTVDGGFYGADWSPTGTQFAFRSDPAAGPGLYVMNVDGTGLRLLTDGLVASPSWSPDGLRIAFQRADEIWMIGEDGTGITNLSVAVAGFEAGPSWGQVPVAALSASRTP